jgi:hypothetical protein
MKGVIRLETKQATSNKTSEKSKRLIYADALKGYFMFLRKMWSETEISRAIDEAPTVDAAPVIHGHWDEGVHHDYCCCSNCRDVYILAEWLTDGKWNYCPNCGAKMDGGTA